MRTRRIERNSDRGRILLPAPRTMRRGADRTRRAAALLPLLWMPTILISLFAPGCSESPSNSSGAPAALGVRVRFADSEDGKRPASSLDASEASRFGDVALSLTEIEARAIELGEANVVRDRDRRSLSPSATRFALRLVVPPAQYYRVDVAAHGTIGPEGSASEPGVVFYGQGFAMDVSAESEQTVEIELDLVVPELAAEIGSESVALFWEPIPGAARYRLKETMGSAVVETAISRTDTLITIGSVARSFRVRAEFEDGIVSAYSRAIATGNGMSADLRVLVVDAQTGEFLPGALVTVLDFTKETNNQGVAEFADLPLGPTIVTVTLEGYVDAVSEVTIEPGRITTERVVLSRAATGGYRFILTWGVEPFDLDSYLVTPPIGEGGQVYEISYQDLGSAEEPPFALLDHDDTDSFGPETITIVHVQPGEYHYYVHNYSGTEDPKSAPLAGSGATLTLIRGSEVLQRVVVPSTGTGHYWDVLRLNAESGSVAIVNEIVENPPAFRSAPSSSKTR